MARPQAPQRAAHAGWRQALLHPAAKPVVWLLWLAPAAWLVAAAVLDRLGPNPAEALIRDTGDWALRALCVALAVTPLRVLTRTPQLAQYRRLLGLFVFFYACLHLACYATFDMGLDLGELLLDVAKRPFILVGMLAWLLLAALAVTSPRRVARALGGRRWQALHRGVYAVAVLAVLHFLWMRAGKNLVGEVAVYAAVLGGLLGWRVWNRLRPRRAAAAA